MPKPVPWYEIKAETATGRAEIFIFGVIVDFKWDEEDVTAKEFVDAIKNLGDIDLHINSPGGSVPAGNAIYNALRRHRGNVDVYIDGLAASMASIVAMGGNRVIMPANAMLMIHDPLSFAFGNAADMRKMAETLDKFKTGMVAAYRDKSGLEESEIERLMSDETWITASGALEMGFADEIEDPVKMAAQFDLSRYHNVPQAFLTPARATGSNQPQQKEKIMDLKELREKHPDLVAQVEAQTHEGMVARTEAETAQNEAVTAENTRILALVQAAMGEEITERIRAAANKGLTAEDLQALGVNLAPAASEDLATREAMLSAITAAAPTGVRTGTTQTGEAAERQAAVSAIAAAGSNR
jgi:ATP-dependent Clp protease protease subunit